MKNGFIIIFVLIIIINISCTEKSDDAIYINKEIIISAEHAHYTNPDTTIYYNYYLIKWDFKVISNFEDIVLIMSYKQENERFFEKAVQYLISNNQKEEFEEMYNCYLYQNEYLISSVGVRPKNESMYYCIVAFNFNGTFRASNTICLKPLEIF